MRDSNTLSKLDMSMANQAFAIEPAIPTSSRSRATLPSATQTKIYIPILDGIRAIACLAVLSYHIDFLARNYGIWRPLHGVNTLIAALIYFGESGVILFFLLSSFLLFLPFARSLLFDTPWPSLRRFYVRRIFRILPGYFVALFLIALFFHPEFLHRNHWQDLWLFLTFRMNYALSQQFNGPFWTLAIEFQFYLLLPILAWLCRLLVGYGSVRWRLFKLSLCLGLMTAWGLVTRYWGQHTTKLDFFLPHAISVGLQDYLFSDTGNFFEVFAVGMFICTLYVYGQDSSLIEYWNTRMRQLSLMLLLIGLALLGFLSLWHLYYICINPYTYIKYFAVFTFLDPFIRIIVSYWLQWQAMGYAISYGLCIYALLYASPRLKCLLEARLLHWIGLISFSLYMWHLPFVFLFLNVILRNIEQQGWNHSVAFGAFWCWILVVVVPISAMLYRWIEQPGVQVGEWLIKRIVR